MKRRWAMRCRKRSRRERFGARTCSSPRSYGTPIIVRSGSSLPSTRVAGDCRLDYIDCYIIHTPFAFQTRRRAGPEGRARSGHLRFRRYVGGDVAGAGAPRGRGSLQVDRPIGHYPGEAARDRCGRADQACRGAGGIASVSPRMGAARLLPRARDCAAGVCSVGTCHGAKRTGRPGDYSHRTACAQDAGSSCPGLGRTARHRFPDHLDQTSAYPGEL